MSFTSRSASPVIIIEDFTTEMEEMSNVEVMEEQDSDVIVISDDEEENVETAPDDNVSLVSPEESAMVETNEDEVIAMDELDEETNVESFWSSEVVIPVPTARHFYTAITPSPEATFRYNGNTERYI
jgi:riboflavin biosynthesis pyrimidine reductase